jgi:hypothetical protein
MHVAASQTSIHGAPLQPLQIRSIRGSDIHLFSQACFQHRAKDFHKSAQRLSTTACSVSADPRLASKKMPLIC